MAFQKITESDRAGKGNVGQPDTPNKGVTEMQEQMDSLANLAIDKFNELVDALNALTAATNMGAEVPEGLTALPNVQSIINSMGTNLVLNTNARHSHNNLETLETITVEALQHYDSLVSVFTGIALVEQLLSNNPAAVPSSAAVKAFVDDYDYRSKVLNIAYPIGAVYCTKGSSPTTLFGGTWNLLDTDAVGVKRYERVG